MLLYFCTRDGAPTLKDSVSASVPWLDELMAELLGFPGVRHDDQVDSISQALAFMGWPQFTYQQLRGIAVLIIPAQEFCFTSVTARIRRRFADRPMRMGSRVAAA